MALRRTAAWTAGAALCLAGGLASPRAARAHNGETPPGGGGSVPAPLAPPFVPPTLVPPTIPPPTTPGGWVPGARTGESSPGWSRWWRANADGIVPPRGRRERVVTVPETPAPGSPPALGAGRTLESVVRPEIVPTLLWAVDPKRACASRVVSAAYLALGKVASRAEDVRPLIDAARSRDAAEEEVEAALLGLGLLRRTDVPARLDATTLDVVRTVLLAALDDRKALPRARGLAAISLALLADQPTGAASPPPPEGAAVARALWATAREPFAGDEIPTAALIGLSFQPRDGVPAEAIEGVRRFATQGRLGKASYGSTARAHALLALARLEDGGAFGVQVGVLLGRNFGAAERRGAIVALGIAAAGMDAARRKETAARVLDTLRDAPSGVVLEPACLMALARILAADLLAGSDALLEDGKVPAALLRGLATPHVEVQPHAMLALWGAALRPEPALQLPRFRDFRMKALEARGRVAREGEGTTENRGAYYVGLGLLEDAESLPLLRQALHRAGGLDPPRACACEAIGLLGRAVPGAVAPLREVLAERGSSADLLERAARALGRLGDPQAPALLLRQLEAGGSDSRLTPLVLALGWTAHVDAVAPLVRLVRDKQTSDPLRAVACHGLGMLGDPEDVPSLSRLAPGTAELSWTEALSIVFSLL